MRGNEIAYSKRISNKKDVIKLIHVFIPGRQGEFRSS